MWYKTDCSNFYYLITKMAGELVFERQGKMEEKEKLGL
jgi:hypothetical protein